MLFSQPKYSRGAVNFHAGLRHLILLVSMCYTLPSQDSDLLKSEICQGCIQQAQTGLVVLGVLCNRVLTSTAAAENSENDDAIGEVRGKRQKDSGQLKRTFHQVRRGICLGRILKSSGFWEFLRHFLWKVHRRKGINLVSGRKRESSCQSLSTTPPLVGRVQILNTYFPNKLSSATTFSSLPYIRPSCRPTEYLCVTRQSGRSRAQEEGIRILLTSNNGPRTP